MKSTCKLLGAAALAAAAAMAAMPAQAEGLYAGLALGTSSFPNSVNGVTSSSTGVSGKVFGGYQLSQNFAVEGSIANLGHTGNNGSGTVASHAEGVDAIGLLPISQNVSLLGSVGLAHINLHTSNGDAAGTALKFGLGGELSLASNIALRAQWERYHTDTFGTNPNVNQFTLGVRFAF
ncbi:MAG: porin family protein [Burkholderiales bacterium]|nr:porin family protein [Burkholderiales bacterium]